MVTIITLLEMSKLCLEKKGKETSVSHYKVLVFCHIKSISIKNHELLEQIWRLAGANRAWKTVQSPVFDFLYGLSSYIHYKDVIALGLLQTAHPILMLEGFLQRHILTWRAKSQKCNLTNKISCCCMRNEYAECFYDGHKEEWTLMSFTACRVHAGSALKSTSPSTAKCPLEMSEQDTNPLIWRMDTNISSRCKWAGLQGWDI